MVLHEHSRVDECAHTRGRPVFILTAELGVGNMNSKCSQTLTQHNKLFSLAVCVCREGIHDCLLDFKHNIGSMSADWQPHPLASVHDLPDEMLIAAASFLKAKDLLSFCATCQRAKNLEVDFLWKGLCATAWEVSHVFAGNSRTHSQNTHARTRVVRRRRLTNTSLR